MTDSELRARFARQLPDMLPEPDWGDVLRRAGTVELGNKRPLGAPSRRDVVGGRAGRRLVVIALAAAVALLMLAAVALGYRYFNQPVSPGFRLYLNKLARGGAIEFNPAQARLRAAVTVPTGDVLLWTAPSKQDTASLVWGFQAQVVSDGTKGIHAAEVRDLGAGCCGDTTAALNDWGGQALSQQAGKELWLEAGHVGAQVVRVAVKFQDGSTENAQLQDGFFLSTINATHFRTGHRPVGLVAYDHSGAIVGQVPIDPSGFQGTHGRSVDLHPQARGRVFLSFPLLVGGAGQIWISKGPLAGSHSWTFVVDGHDQLLGAGYAALKDNPSNRRAVNLSALRYRAHGRREIVYGGDTWQIHSLIWIHPNGTRTPIAIRTTPTQAWTYIGNVVIFQTRGWKPAHGVLIARDRHGRIVHRIDLSRIIVQPNN
jgi:hypothetical protein